MGKKKDQKNCLDVIIETPRSSRNKYAWDEDDKAFRLTKVLPAGAVFPFDFGFIPETKGEDGDPLDILLIMDEAAYPGCIIECRVLGILCAEQREEDGVTVRNDRLVGVAVASPTYNDWQDLEDINIFLKHEIEHFFISYNDQAGKKFKPLGWEDAEKAMKQIKKSHQ